MKRDAMPSLSIPYPITDSMIRNRANAHSKREDAVFYLNPRSILLFSQELIEGARGAPWPLAPLLPGHCPNPGELLLERAKKLRLGTPPPDAAGDTLRLNLLEHAGGFLRGSDGGREAYRIMGFNSWHPTLRAAIDEIQ